MESIRCFPHSLFLRLTLAQSTNVMLGWGIQKLFLRYIGVKTECTIFVPFDAQVEIRDIKITNISGEPFEIDVIPVVEYTHFDAVKQFTNADWVPQTMQSRCTTESNGLRVLSQYAFMKRDTAVNYFTSNQPVSSFESCRKRFLGDNEYGTWAHPLSLDKDELDNYEADRGDNIGALLHHLGVMKPGEQKRIITQLGQKISVKEAMLEIAEYRKPEIVDAALKSLSDFWNDHLSTMKIKTPDAGLDSMINVHNPRQCYITFNWSRYLSYYQLGWELAVLAFATVLRM